MNKKIKAKWLKALRSGKFKQGKDQLRLGNRFCCLGVLCEIQRGDYDGDKGTPPVKLRAGLSQGQMNILIDANDLHDWSFPQIADYVEVML